MRSKSVIPTHRARQDVETEIDYYLFEEGSERAALGFIAAIEEAYLRLGRNPAMGSPRYAYELDLPGLRSWPIKRYPHLVFYVDRDDHVEIWRVMTGARDIPAWLLNLSAEPLKRLPVLLIADPDQMLHRRLPRMLYANTVL